MAFMVDPTILPLVYLLHADDDTESHLMTSFPRLNERIPGIYVPIAFFKLRLFIYSCPAGGAFLLISHPLQLPMMP